MKIFNNNNHSAYLSKLLNEEHLDNIISELALLLEIKLKSLTNSVGKL